MTETTTTTTATDEGWICPNNPLYHDWRKGLECHSCGTTRPADEALMSVLVSARGCSDADAERLRDAFLDQKLAERDGAIPAALAAMLPYGTAAQQAAQIVSQSSTLAGLLHQLREYTATTDRSTADAAERLIGLLEGFDKAITQEWLTMKRLPPAMPLADTSARSIVQTLAEAVLTMPEPGEAPGEWRQAAHDHIKVVGAAYEQVWKYDATYWKYTA
jgi:hypothetical protein